MDTPVTPPSMNRLDMRKPFSPMPAAMTPRKIRSAFTISRRTREMRGRGMRHRNRCRETDEAGRRRTAANARGLRRVQPDEDEVAEPLGGHEVRAAHGPLWLPHPRVRGHVAHRLPRLPRVFVRLAHG